MLLNSVAEIAVEFGVEVAQSPFLVTPQRSLEAARVGTLLDDRQQLRILVEYFAQLRCDAERDMQDIGAESMPSTNYTICIRSIPRPSA